MSNNDSKISLSINLQGSAFVRKGVQVLHICNLPEKEIKMLLKKNKFRKLIHRGEDGKYYISHKDLINKPVTQVINLTEEAYFNFTSKYPPEWYNKSASMWSLLNKKEKIELHCHRICQHIGGYSFSFKILGE